jgi:hypothetical protein
MVRVSRGTLEDTNDTEHTLTKSYARLQGRTKVKKEVDVKDEAEEEEEEEEEKTLKFAKQVKSWVKTEPMEEEVVVDAENPEGITFTATTEFCRGLGAKAEDDEWEKKTKKEKVTSHSIT